MMQLFLPGSVVGVLGSGQLGRMFTLAARRLGYRVHTFSPETDTPTGQVADVEWSAPYQDLDKIHAFARQVDVVTFEFENVPAETCKAIEQLVPIHPSAEVLFTTQQRIREKTFLQSAGFPVTPFGVLENEEQMAAVVEKIGFPAVLKTAGFGYDGKGQRIVRSIAELITAFRALGSQPCILEAFVDFQSEMSIVAVRNEQGQFCHYGPVENRHKNHILDMTLSPYSVPESLYRQAVDIARGILEKLNVVGVMCVEMFNTKNNTVLVNELAPRPHNSGHFTIDACAASQFEQQLRAVCGLPLASTEQPFPAVMVNLLGDLWQQGEPRWEQALKQPNVRLHLYGKKAALKGRKMGHLTAIAKTLSEAEALAVHARQRLSS